MKFFNVFLFMLVLLVFSSPLSGFWGEIPDKEPVPGEAIIRFSANVDSFEVEHINGHCEIGIDWFDSLSILFGIYNMHKVFTSDDSVLTRIWKIYFPETLFIETVTSAFEIQDDIVYAETNGFYYLMGVPNDPLYENQWAHIKYLDSELAWDIETGDPNIIVGIIDGGADLDHEDLIGMFTDPVGNNWVHPELAPYDSFGHGTHVAGIIGAATNNGTGVVGMAGGWGQGGVSGGVRMMILKCFRHNTASWSVLAQAIEYAAKHPTPENPCNIISMSWGGEESSVIHNAITYAYNKNCVLVVAAGNGDKNTKVYRLPCRLG